jgi:hypothetical protein
MGCWTETCVLSDRPLGYKHTEESKKIMSEKKKGIKQTSENIAKRIEGMKGRKHSEQTKEKMRQSKLGEKNPMFGVKYSEEKRNEKVANMLSVTRWNKGKTKETDPLMAKLSEKLKGRSVYNSLKCRLINLESLEEWIADSIIKLSEGCPLSLASLNRLKSNKNCQTKLLKQYKLEIINES